MDRSEIELIVSATDKASGVLAGVGGSLRDFEQQASKVGLGLLPISIGAGVVAGSAIKMAADYEQSMNVLQAASGASAEEMAALDRKAIELGADITLPGTSAKDAAEAMLELSKAGMSVNDVLDASDGVLKLSAAGQIANAEAAQITANVLNTFGMEGKAATTVAAMLAAGANASSASMTDLAMGVRQGGFAFRAVGLPASDLITSLAALTNVGLTGSDAGTALKNAFMQLAAPTDKAAALMEKLGIDVFDAQGQMLPMPELLTELNTGLGGMTQEQRLAALSTMVLSDGAKALIPLLDLGADGFTELQARINEESAASDMAAAQNKGLNGALDGLGSTMETVLLSGARPLLDVLAGLVTQVAGAVGAFAAANPQLVTAGLAFAGVLAVAGPLLLAVGPLAGVIGALVSPIGLVVLAVGVLAGAFATDFMGIRTAVEGLVGGIQNFALTVQDAGIQSSEAWEALSAIVGEGAATMIQTFLAEIPNAVAQLRAMWEPAWQQIKMIVEGVFIAIRDIVTRVLGIVIGSIQDHAANLQGLFENAWFRARDIVVGVLDGLRQIVMTVLAQVQIFLANHGTEIRQALGNAWEQIGRIINLALDVIRATVIPLLTGVAKFIRDHGQEIQIVMNGAWTLIRTIVETVLDTIEGLIRTVLAVIRGDWKGAWEEVKKIADGLWTGIKTIIETALNTILGIVGTNLGAVKQWFLDKFNEIQAFLRSINLGDIGRAMIQGLIDGIGAMAGALVARATGVVQGAIDAAKRLLGISSPSTVFHEIGVMSMTGLAQGFEESQPITIDAISEHIQAIVAELARLANDVVAPAAVQSAKAFSDAVAPVFENVRDIVEGIVALAGLSGVNLPQNVPGLMTAIAQYVELLTARLSEVASRIPDLGAAARGLAENVGPVLEIVADAVGAFGALNDPAVMKDVYADGELGVKVVEMNIWKLAYFARDLAAVMGAVALTVKVELQAAAKLLAENMAPVVEIVETAVGAFGALNDPAVMKDVYADGELGVKVVEMNIWKLAYFARDLAAVMGAVALTVKVELQAAAKALAETLGPVLGIVEEGLSAFAGLAGLNIGALPAAQAGVKALSTFLGSVFSDLGGLRPEQVADAAFLAETGSSLFALLREAIEGMGALAKLDTQDMRAWAMEAGLGWITGLADGIRGGMAYLEAALGAVATAMTGTFGAGLSPAAAAGATGGTFVVVNNSVTINNPVVRAEADIEAIAAAVSEALGAEANTLGRMRYQWAG